MGFIDADGRGKGGHAPSATQSRAKAHKRLARRRGFAKTKDEGLVFSDGTGNIAKVSAKKGKKVAKQKYKTVRSARTGKRVDDTAKAAIIAALMGGPSDIAPATKNVWDFSPAEKAHYASLDDNAPSGPSQDYSGAPAGAEFIDRNIMNPKARLWSWTQTDVPVESWWEKYKKQVNKNMDSKFGDNSQWWYGL